MGSILAHLNAIVNNHKKYDTDQQQQIKRLPQTCTLIIDPSFSSSTSSERVFRLLKDQELLPTLKPSTQQTPKFSNVNIQRWNLRK